MSWRTPSPLAGVRPPVLFLLVLLLFAARGRSLRGEDEARPRVVVLATGGTIAGTSASETDAGYDPSKLSVEALLAAVPGLSKLADIRGEQVVNIASQDMEDAVWLRLARRVDALLGDGETTGVVITHGTDTMEETAFFLDLVTKHDGPVVLTGAMRPATSLSADGPLNLFNAVAVAADPASRGRGAMVVMNDRILPARSVTKLHTTAVETFAAPATGPLGSVHYGHVRYESAPSRRHAPDVPFALGDREALPRVDILYAHANLPGDLIPAAVEAGTRGIVVAGVGNGNLSQPGIAALAAAAKAGVAVVRSTRVPSGPVLRNLEIDDDALGFVAAGVLSPPKARILLQLALTRTRDPAAIQVLFDRF